MGNRHPLQIPLLASLLVAASTACTTEANYLDREGPRFAGDHAPYGAAWSAAVAPETDEVVSLTSFAPGSIKVVSYNVRYGEELELAIRELSETPELRDADVFLLQEMNAAGVDRVARALGCSYVYYPASQRTWGLDFGNAVLTRGRIVGDRKVLLPHLHPINRQARIAVGTDIELEGQMLSAYSVHTEMPLLSMRGRTDQVDALLTAAAPGSSPCLIAGDFNTVTRNSLRRFENVFAERGFERASEGLGTTWAYGPFQYRLDHVFVRGFEVVGVGKVESATASDHIPIWVELVPTDSGGVAELFAEQERG